MSCIGVQENRNTSQEETGKGKKKKKKIMEEKGFPARLNKKTPFSRLKNYVPKPSSMEEFKAFFSFFFSRTNCDQNYAGKRRKKKKCGMEVLLIWIFPFPFFFIFSFFFFFFPFISFRTWFLLQSLIRERKLRNDG